MALARKRILHDRLGGTIDLPLLLPSFSSKGFAVLAGEDTHTRRSSCSPAFTLFGKSLESFLVSAYDLHHQLLETDSACFVGKSALFIDSGGYELSKWFDLAEPATTDHTPLEFCCDDYHAVLSTLPVGRPVAITSFDWSTRQQPFVEQIRAADEFFNGYDRFIRNFLIKPGAAPFIDVGLLRGLVDRLVDFEIVGVTEKELGPTLAARLINLARLRLLLDSAGLQLPIHVFGGLDPVITPLYFFAGADIFDGLGWLRYGYRDGVASYWQASSFLETGVIVEEEDDYVLARNVRYLSELSDMLSMFGESQDVSVFGHHRGPYRTALDWLSDRLEILRKEVNK